jgi:ankyrin repeat protein
VGEYGSPLHQAASRGHLQTVEALLDEGCLVSVADKNGRTPLHWISNIDHLEVVRELIREYS